MAKTNTRSTVGCLIRRGQDLLMVLEVQDGKESWDIPAGGIDPGETPEQAALREVYEETGIHLNGELQLVGVFWVADPEVPTAHFLYRYELPDDDHTVPLGAQDADITAVAFQPSEFVRKLISTEQYEHLLAKARLECFLTDNEIAEPLLRIV